MESHSNRSNTGNSSVNAFSSLSYGIIKITELTNSFIFCLHLSPCHPGPSASATCEQILQMKYLQFLKPFLIQEHHSCTHFLQLKQRTGFAPTPFQQTTHESLIDVVLLVGRSCLEHMTLFFPKFTLTLPSSSLISCSTHQVM